MPSVRRGASSVTAIRRGATVVNQIRRGTALVWSPSNMFDDFNRPDASDIDPTEEIWADDDGAPDPYTIGVVGNACRLAIPDNITAYGFLVRRRRYVAAQAAGDDGHLEVRIASMGSSDYSTDAFRRASNTGFANGVGIRMKDSQLLIVRRVGGTDAEVKNCGSFSVGDVARLTQAGNLHTLRRNGEFVGEWNDVGGTAATGSSNRSMAIRQAGIKDYFGARRFSPALDYIECA